MKGLRALCEEVLRSLGEGPPAARRQAQRRQFLEAASTPRRPSWRWVSLGAAAAVAAVAAVVVIGSPWRAGVEGVSYWVASASEPSPAGQTLEAPADAPLPLRFGDGSRVRFGPRSTGLVRSAQRAAVSVALTDGTLDADIIPRAQSGVAWRFEGGPFVVQVVGTAFELRFVRAQRRLELDLRHGRVLVTGPGLPEGVALTEGQRLVVEEGGAPRVSALEPLAEVDARGDAGVEAGPVEDVEDAEDPAEPGRASPPRVRRSSGESEWRALASRKDYEGAFAAAREEGFERLVRRASLPDLMLLCDVARYAHQPVEARQALAALERRFPRSAEVRLVPFLRGRLALEEERDAKLAAAEFRAYLARNPQGQLVEEATGRLLQALKLQGDGAAARETARRYLERFPQGSYAPLARSVAGSGE